MGEKKVPEDVVKTEVGEEFRVCPECGYENGFHSMFRPDEDGGTLSWLFICPNCSTRFDVGLKVRRD